MKAKIIFFLIISFQFFVISCNPPKKSNVTDSVQALKEEEISNQPHLKKFKSYFKNDSLYIFDNNEQELKRIKIFAIDTLHRIVQSQNGNYLFIALASYGDAIFQFMGLIDLKTNKWIVYNKLDLKSDEWNNCVLANPNYLGTTTDNKFHLFEGGTGIMREFQIYNSTGELIKKGSSIVNTKTAELKWDSNNKLYYYEKDEFYPDSLKKPKENYQYVRRKFWHNGKDYSTNYFKEIYIE